MIARHMASNYQKIAAMKVSFMNGKYDLLFYHLQKRQLIIRNIMEIQSYYYNITTENYKEVRFWFVIFGNVRITATWQFFPSLN
jgi:hypothetical protein